MRDNHKKKKHTVKDHFEQWPFPGTDFFSREGLLLLRYMEKWLQGESSAQSETFSVIDVGCGTGQTTMALAKNFPGVSFLGIDISEKSIEKAIRQADRTELTNIAFKRRDLKEDLSDLGRFNIVLSLGVLHHIADFEGILHNVVRVVKTQGYLIVWLYGYYGRFRHNVNQEFLKLLTKDMDKVESLAVAKTFLEDLGLSFAAGSGFYTPKGSGKEGLAWMLAHLQWLADQMIPAYERSVKLSDILRSFKAQGLEFWKWVGVPHHLESYTSSEVLLACFERLSPHEQLMAIDALIKPEYYFVVGKKRN